ncbi:MAG: aspartate aminotransferase family protein [Candidatus Hydrogenedentes bacterium]|nr:aspartate aminotransferase family protein [Candidatus Hydrogenedentota bacterium]
MATTEQRLPDSLKAEGEWANIFSYHPLDVVLERAEGIYLYGEDGKRYIDASGGPMAVNLGHGDPRMRAAVLEQMDKFSYCHPVLANRKRAELCEKIADIAPGDLNTSYLVSGGSEAVETAMKVARQYHVFTGNPGKHKIISNHESYHGMTLATLGVSGSWGTQRHFDDMIPHWPHIHQYSDYRKPEGMSREEWAVQSAHELEIAINYAGHQSVAAYLATPHGAGCDYGVVPPKEYWQTIRDICDRYDVLFIADEVVTGFGRTGRWFAMEHFGVQADIMTTAKGISSMYAPLGAVTVSDRVNEPFKTRGFNHGFTSGGHGVACATGLKTIEIIEEDGLLENCRRVGEHLFTYRDRILAHPTIKDVRGWGLFMVSELIKDKETMEFFERDQRAEHLYQSIALKNGLVLYGALYGARRSPAMMRGLPTWISPPICITEEQVDDMMERFDATLSEWEDALGVG